MVVPSDEEVKSSPEYKRVLTPTKKACDDIVDKNDFSASKGNNFESDEEVRIGRAQKIL